MGTLNLSELVKVFRSVGWDKPLSAYSADEIESVINLIAHHTTFRSLCFGDISAICSSNLLKEYRRRFSDAIQGNIWRKLLLAAYSIRFDELVKHEKARAERMANGEASVSEASG
jgi:hypothetical protein